MSFFRENKDLWWAHIDGELTPAESAEFDRSLSDEDRARLMGDNQLENELAEIFSEPVACPEEAWKLALRQIHEAKYEAKRPRAPRRVFRRSMLAALPLAACVLVAISVFMYGNKPEPQKPWLLYTNDQEAAHAQVPGKSTSVREFLEEQGLALAFDPSNLLEGDGVPYHLLGARQKKFHEQTVVELFFNCEGKPAKVVIAPKGGDAAEQLGNGLARGTVRETREIGNVVIAVVGDCAPHELIGMVEDPITPKIEPPQSPPVVEEVKKPDIQDAVQDKIEPEAPPPPLNVEDATPTLPHESGASTVV